MKRIPASPIEAQFYVAGRVHPAPGLNTIAHAVSIRGPLAPDLLAAALRRLCAAHDALRSRIEEAGGAVVRVIAEEGPREPLDVWPAADTADAIAGEVDRVRRALSPESLPWRAVLLTHGPENHTFVFAAHRCVWDERSTTIFGVELSAHYARGAGPEGPSGPVVDSTTAAAPASISAPAAAGGARRLAAALIDVPATHGFPTRGARPKAAEADSAGSEVAFDRGTQALLGEMASGWGVEPFLVRASAILHVLAYYCGQDRVAIGLPFDVSGGPGERTRLGSFTAMLPVGFDAAALDFETLVGELAKRVREAAAHAATPFDAIARERGARGEPFANPLFQIACIEDADLHLTLDGCETSLRQVRPPPQQLDLFLRVTPGALRIAYDSRWIGEDVVRSFALSVVTFLAAALREPRRDLYELPLLDDSTREALVGDALRTAEPSLLEADLYRLVTRHATRESTKIAITGGGREVSYGELLAAVEALAVALAASGPGTDGLVGICLPRSVDMVVAVLAVLRSGSAYVPLDPAFPEQRLEYMVSHSRLSCVVTTRALRPLFDRAGVRVVDIGVAAASREAAPPPAAVASDARAYVIYTSGSTGKPKGVAVPRRAVTSFLLSMLSRPGVGPDDRLCAVTTLSFDIATLEILAPLSAGGTVIIATEEEARDPRLLIALLESHHATMLQATPITWQLLCAAGWSGDRALTALCGGEALVPALARELVPRVRALWNMYGPTETTVWSTCQRIEAPEAPISIGTPIANTAAYVVDGHLRPVPAGVEGRLFIGGVGVALGYLYDEDRTRQRFVPDPFRGKGRMYDTGDRARRDATGNLYLVGRTDSQVKLRGFRIELGEVEACLSTFKGIEQVACAVRRDDPEAPELVAYYVLASGAAEPTVADLRAHCHRALPVYMVPSRFQRLSTLARTPNGKLDRAALPKPDADAPASRRPSLPRSDIERTILDIWCSVLAIPSASVHDNFFELGGTSLAAFSVVSRMGRQLGVELSVLTIFEHPTVATLAEHLKGDRAQTSAIREAHEHAQARRRTAASPTAFDVAIVGAAGRFPGARNLDELWKNLCDGRETVTFFRRDELDPLVSRQDRDDPSYVPARGVLEDVDLFDAAFFGISPNEAELMAPQLRVFLEVAWEAFENAGTVGEKIRGPVGVWAGMGNNFYYLYNVLTRPDKLAIMGEIAAEIANEKDHIAPRISHKLNLTGPSVSVHTACSTTLVVIENAYQALVSHQVDAALAGGVDIRTPQKSGQRHEEGGVFSIDGHCRPFDADATGTMFGEGVGAIVMKRLDDAVRDGDTIYAVIKGAAINHDGGHKVSYLAPSVEGQARVIATALGIADVNPDTISLVEAHGTATPIGDPIEVEALTRVYRAFTHRRGYCALGSIKGNIGHATTAAGIAGVLKVVMALRHGKIPPTLHFRTPNPRIDFASSPFFVNDKLIDWRPEDKARRASVSSFGFCGTNAHVILEEAPPSPATSPPARPAQLVLLAARSRAALDATAERVASALAGASPAALADMAFTTHVGRKRHEHRRCAVVLRPDEAPVHLAQAAGPRSASLESDVEDPPVAFMFPGQGAQYVDMGLRLYQNEPRFRETVDRCATVLSPELGCDLRALLFPDPSDVERARESLNRTQYTQPAIFVISYALASLYQHWGVRPSAFIGHSIGEFVAATLSGVMEIEDALKLVAARGRLMQGLPSGSMLSVRLAVEALAPRLPAGVDLAAVNGPLLCVVSGPTPLVAALSETLSAEGVPCRVLHTSHAFHSSMMDPVVEPFSREVERVRLSPPRIPFVSTVTGEWIEASQATSPSYWARHLRSPVEFSKALRVLLSDGARVVLECGPRRTSAALALQQRPANPGRVVAAMPDSAEPDDEYPSLLLALGSLWLNGCSVDWAAFHEDEVRRRRALPPYPFQRKRYWIEPGSTVSFGLGGSGAQTKPRAGAVSPEHTGNDGESVAASPSRDGSGESTRDQATASVVALLEELLGHELEGFDEDAPFIALGIDSLILTQLARATRVRLGFDVSFRQLVERYSTTKLLAGAIRDRQRQSAPPPLASAAPVAASDAAASLSVAELATTPAQLEIWWSVLSGPEAACAHNQSFAVHLTGAVDDEALARALRSLPDRHESLRGRYGKEGDRFFVDPHVDLPIPHHDLSSLARDKREEALGRLVEQDARTPYDVERGPLVRATVVTLGPGERTVLLGVHHGACDGWSLDVLLADLGRLYSAIAGAAPTPPPPLHGFSDYVRLRAGGEYAHKIAASREYWHRTLDPPPLPLELPLDGRRPPLRSYGATHALRRVAPGSVSPLKAFARAHGITFFSVLLSGYAVLLHRLSGATDFVVGVPVAGHPGAGMEDCVGHMVDMVPVRFRVDPERPFLDLCRTTSASLLDAREHAAVSFGEIVADIAVQRDPSRVPLIAATFTHVQRLEPGKLSFAGCTVDYHLNPRAFETFEIALNAVEGPDGLELMIHGNADLFGRTWLELRLHELEHLLQAGAGSPETPVSRVPLLPQEERALLERYSATAADFPRDACISHLFEWQAALTPDAVAVLRDGESVGYRDLDTRANQLSRVLRARGVRRGVLVGLCLNRSIDMVVAVLAVMKAGGAYLPLDPAFPPDRLAFMVGDSRLALVVSQSDLADKHGCGAERTIALDLAADSLGRESAAALPRDVDAATAEDVAYVLYTSGSTGKPKGVEVQHRAAVNFLVSMRREPGLAPEDRLLAVTTLSFDIALLELMLPLTVGAQVVLATRDVAVDGAALRRLLERERVTVMQATPATWRLLVEAGWRGSPNFKALCGGEALPVDLAEALIERVGQLWNMYGPTETTVWSTCGRVREPRLGISIGRPIANTSVWILDGDLGLCAVGVPGEMYIGGEGVALGYRNRPELTRERFVANPFSLRPGARLYRTGDLGRWRTDGRLEHMGRTDAQLKIRGFRIEPGEIESRLTEHASVQEAYVLVRDRAEGDARLTAYFAPGAGKSVTYTDLRKHLRAALPEYMIPQAWVEVPRLPRLPNGKVDRKALPAPCDEERPADEVLAPRTEVERLVAEVWSEVIGRKDIGVQENFFDAGGHSLLVIKTIGQIAARTGVELSPRLFAVDTLAQIAAEVEQAMGERGAPPGAIPPPSHEKDGLLGRIRSRLFR